AGDSFSPRGGSGTSEFDSQRHSPGHSLSGREWLRPRIEVQVIRGASVKRGVRPPAIVESYVDGQFRSRLGPAIVRVQVNVFIFDRLPQPLDKHVVAPAALAIHADVDGLALQHADELTAGELAALIGIHDLGHTIFRDRL